MKNPIIDALNAECRALSGRITMLARASSEIQTGGLCGYGFGHTDGENFYLDDTPELSRRIGNIIARQWQRCGR